VASVSGGSIAAAALAAAWARVGRVAGTPLSAADWDAHVAAPIHALTSRNIRTGPLLRRLLPWNLRRSETVVEALARRYEDLTNLPLSGLPPAPEFQFLATDMAYGVAWAFTREWMGDYQVGYMRPPADFTVARAVAASACFPPLFDPMRLRLDPAALTGGTAPRDARREECLSDFRLTDGGDYDNMGLEPVWKSHAVVLVSDAGGLFTAQSDKGLLWRVPRYQAIQERQARGLRKRWLVAGFGEGAVAGTYWSVGGAASHYDPAATGYGEDLSREVIAEIRTDLDAFSDAEKAVLENHGYLLAEAALRRHAPALLAGAKAASVPRPDWYPPVRGEADVRAALEDSGRRSAWGRSGS
jgi:NTE family protein